MIHLRYISLTSIISGWHIDYILLTASDVQKYSTGSITICPADKALLDVRSNVRIQVILSDSS